MFATIIVSFLFLNFSYYNVHVSEYLNIKIIIITRKKIGDTNEYSLGVGEFLLSF